MTRTERKSGFCFTVWFIFRVFFCSLSPSPLFLSLPLSQLKRGAAETSHCDQLQLCVVCRGRFPSSRSVLPPPSSLVPSLVMRPGSVLVRNAYSLLRCSCAVFVCVCPRTCAPRLPAGLSSRPLSPVAVTSRRVRLMIGRASGEGGVR